MVELFLLRSADRPEGEAHPIRLPSGTVPARADRAVQAPPEDNIVIDLVAMERRAGRTDR
jgi:hypothetical protein